MTKSKTQSERKREAILAAARQCFQEDGVKTTSMDKIAEVAHVSKRTVYNHFESKEALLLHLLSDLWLSNMVNEGIAFDEHSDLREQLISVCLAEADLVGSAEYINLARVAYDYYLFQPEAIPAEVQELIAQETFVHRWIRDAMQAGKLKSGDVNQATMQLHSLIKGEAHWPQIINIAEPLLASERQGLVERTVDMFLSFYCKK